MAVFVCARSSISTVRTFCGRIILLTLVGFCKPTPGQITPDRAAAVWLQMDGHPFGEKLGMETANIETIEDEQGHPLFHVVNLQPSGFVIVSTDNSVEPIAGFSARGHFKADSFWDRFARRDLGGRLKIIVSHPHSAAAEQARRKWGQLDAATLFGSTNGSGPLHFNGLTAVSQVMVAPFIATHWGQGTTTGGLACYNYYTPPGLAGSVNNDPCGCVATALAQVLCYYRYPNTGVGALSFPITISGISGPVQATLRGGDGAGGVYPWSIMPLAPGAGVTTEQCQAIGDLCYDSGVAVGMSYSPSVSDATFLAAANALASTFHFGVRYDENETSGVGGGLAAMLNPNLDARQPVLLGIEPNDGHCAICDGYGYNLGTLYYHLNMGLAGDDDGWYALPVVDSTDLGTYTNVVACIYNIYTNGAGEIVSGRVTDGGGLPVSGATVTATQNGINLSATTTDTNGIYALTHLPAGANFHLTAGKPGYALGNTNIATGATNSSAVSGNFWGANFVLTPPSPPTLLTQPSSQAVLAGATVTFAAPVTGAVPLLLRWQKNGTNLSDNANISGSATSFLILSNVTTASSGDYSLAVSNALGTTVSAFAGLTVYSPTSTNLLQNGGFETGNFSGWTLTGNTSGVTVATTVQGILLNHSGIYGAGLGPSTIGYLSQTLPTAAGSSYQVSFWLKSDGQLNNYFLATWNGATNFAQTNLPAVGWTNVTLLVTATNSQSVLRFGFFDAPSYIALDDISVTNLAVSGSPVFFETGAGGLGYTGQQLQLQLGGLNGQGPTVIDATTDFTHWLPIFTNAFGSGVVSIIDTNAGNFPSRFYRARTP
jgi:hypothetical protein